MTQNHLYHNQCNNEYYGQCVATLLVTDLYWYLQLLIPRIRHNKYPYRSAARIIVNSST